MPKVAPYGTWASPITSDAITQNSIGITHLFVDQITTVIYHLETRPSEGGRSVIVKTEDGRDLFGRGFDARTRVQEYGGGAAIAHNDMVYFSNLTDSRVYEVKFGSEPSPISPEYEHHRFADFSVNPSYPSLIVAVLEDHTKPAPSEVVTTLCIINVKTKNVSPLVSGADFYAAPRFSPDGVHLIWQQWSHPDMPWESAQIYVAVVDTDGTKISLRDEVHVAGEKNEVSAAFPAWASNDTIFFTNDISGYQNPWSFSLATKKAVAILGTPIQQDFSEPAWTLGGSFAATVDADGEMIISAALKDGRTVLYLINHKLGILEELECPYVKATDFQRVKTHSIVFMAGKSDEPAGIVLLTLDDYSKMSFKSLKTTSSRATSVFSRRIISIPQPITINVPPKDKPLYINFYPPTNPDFVGPEGEKPPCVVNVHGGPTGNADQLLSWNKQYFTSRGWAWLDVNYGGSSGYGRKYIQRLAGNWGIVDVNECVLAVQHLSKTVIDSQRVFLRGRSSGGFTVLAALCNAPDVFAGATSVCGVSDLAKLVGDTHKFESKYMDKLLGGPITEIPDVYRDRSPVFHADKIKTPVLILQGSDDVVVPPSQAEAITRTIQDHGREVKYVVYQGEGHSWRKAETIKASLQEELLWYESLIDIPKNRGISDDVRLV